MLSLHSGADLVPSGQPAHPTTLNCRITRDGSTGYAAEPGRYQLLPDVRELLDNPNYAVISTKNRDGSIHQTVIWVDAENGSIAVNSAVARMVAAIAQR